MDPGVPGRARRGGRRRAPAAVRPRARPGSRPAAPSPDGGAIRARPAAIDLLAAAPLVSATSLAAGLGMAVKNAAALLEQFQKAGIVVEVTHRSKRRLLRPRRARAAARRRGAAAAAGARERARSAAPSSRRAGSPATASRSPAFATRAACLRLQRAGGGHGRRRGEHPARATEPGRAAIPRTVEDPGWNARRRRLRPARDRERGHQGGPLGGVAYRERLAVMNCASRI